MDEIARGVNIALGNFDLSECPVFDPNQDGEVTIEELIQAVNVALHGCVSSGRTVRPVRNADRCAVASAASPALPAVGFARFCPVERIRGKMRTHLCQNWPG